MPDINTEYEAFKTAGISIGETNCYHLSKVLRELAIENDVKEIRFWGKILGKKDYYVIQGLTSKSYVNDLGPNSEPYGTGINDYSYWVSNNVLGKWSELPLISPCQLTASREFKYVFSGNL